MLGLFKGETEKFQWHGRMGYVHIDDVALSHILLYENKASHESNEHTKSKPSDSICNSQGSVYTEERGLSTRMIKVYQ